MSFVGVFFDSTSSICAYSINSESECSNSAHDGAKIIYPHGAGKRVSCWPPVPLARCATPVEYAVQRSVASKPALRHFEH